MHVGITIPHPVQRDSICCCLLRVREALASPFAECRAACPAWRGAGTVPVPPQAAGCCRVTSADHVQPQAGCISIPPSSLPGLGVRAVLRVLIPSCSPSFSQGSRGWTPPAPGAGALGASRPSPPVSLEAAGMQPGLVPAS